MKERPIIFSAAMVRAILDGTKTVTRRIVKPQPELREDCIANGWVKPTAPESYRYWWPSRLATTMVEVRDMGSLGPYGTDGDRLWVREAHAISCIACDAGMASLGGCICGTRESVSYRADVAHPSRGWTSPIFMPRWASRILLAVVSVRVERLHDLDELEALAEGVQGPARDEYARLWDTINGAGSWDSNPWVWRVEFKRVAAEAQAA